MEELRGDGMPGPRAVLRRLDDVAVLPDGGVIFVEGLDADRIPDGPRDPGLVRYLPPASGGLLAVAVRRDRDRIFPPNAPAWLSVSLTAPADVTVTVTGASGSVATLQQALPAGETRLDLPPLAGEPHTATISAQDADGRVAGDRAALLPRGWLSDSLARGVAGALIFTALPQASGYSGDGLGRCQRFGPARIDCRVRAHCPCPIAITVRLGTDGRLRWGTYRSPVAPRKPLIEPLRRLRRGHYQCEIGDASCPAPLFGVVADRWLVPWD